MNKRLKYLIKIVMPSVFLICGAMFYLGVYHSMTIAESFASCKGVELYYTNTSFWQDWTELHSNLNRNCDADVPDTLWSSYHMYDFTAIKNCPGNLDCEDVSHMARCLADKYNVKCKFYMWLGIYYPSHMGIRCELNGYMEDVF
jgi:hypothetical protein